MLDRFVYENHLGQRFDGLKNGVYLNYSTLRDYLWSIETINGKISRLFHEVTERTLPLVFVGKTDDEAATAKNRLLELAETDIEAMIPGKIFIGDYYTNGYITSSAKSEYLINNLYCRNELTLTSDDPMWYREQTYAFNSKTTDLIGSGKEADYPYDYSYDYAISQNGRKIVCDSVRSSAFRLCIYGEATNPTITIGGHVYAINGSIGAGESLLIDSLSKKIILTTAKGGKINWFDKRSRDSYVFEPIPAGQNTVYYNGSFGFDLTVIEKRSEPKWI